MRFQLDPASHPFSTTRPDIQAVSITKAQGTLEVKGASSLGAGWAALGFAIISLARLCSFSAACAPSSGR